jgi:hypothetical protein
MSVYYIKNVSINGGFFSKILINNMVFIFIYIIQSRISQHI